MYLKKLEVVHENKKFEFKKEFTHIVLDSNKEANKSTRAK